PDAVFAGRRPDADFWHHGLHQSGAWLAVYDRRLLRGNLQRADGIVLARAAAGADRHRRGGRTARDCGVASPVPARSYVAGVGDVRTDPNLQRGGPHDLGRPAADAQYPAATGATGRTA